MSYFVLVSTEATQTSKPCILCYLLYVAKFSRPNTFTNRCQKGGRNIRDKNIRESSSDTLCDTVTWLLRSSVRLVGSLTVDESFSVLYAVMCLANTQYSFSKRLTGAARFFQEGTGPASFNSNRMDIATAWLRAHCYFVCCHVHC